MHLMTTIHLSSVSTTAAVGAHRTRRWIVASRIVALAIRRILVASSSDSRLKRREYPSRCAYFERSRMGREIDRL
jgi:hypothetical protein